MIKYVDVRVWFGVVLCGFGAIGLHVVLDGSIQLSTLVNWIFIPGVVVRKYKCILKWLQIGIMV